MDGHKLSKLLTCYLSLVVICLFCTLGSLDAVEYVRCDHIGVCEFLELSGDLISDQTAETVAAIMMNRYINPYRYQEILTPPAERIIEVVHHREPMPLLIRKKCLPLQTLHMITTTIIKS